MPQREESAEEVEAYRAYLDAHREYADYHQGSFSKGVAMLLGLPNYRRAERRQDEAWATYCRLAKTDGPQ